MTLAYASVKNCKPDSILKIKSLSTLELVHPGQNITLNVNYSSPGIITNGTSEISTRYNYIFTNSFTDSICNTVACPITTGDHSEWFVYNIPEWLTGVTNTRIIWKDYNYTLLCIEISLKIKSRMK